MKHILFAAGTLSALALSASASSAAPYAGSGRLTPEFNAAIVQVHGVHRECIRGRWGWHRSTPWGGRIACRPHFDRRDDGDRGHHEHHEGRGRDHDDRNDGPPPPRRIPRGSY